MKTRTFLVLLVGTAVTAQALAAAEHNKKGAVRSAAVCAASADGACGQSARDSMASMGRLQIGDTAYNTERESVLVRVVGIENDGDYAIRFLEGTLINQIGGNWTDQDLAITRGCGPRFCVGEDAFNVERDSVEVRVLGLQWNGRYVLQFLEGELAGKRGSNWDEPALAELRGCGMDDYCVGERAYNLARDSAEVRIAGIMENGKLVLEFLDGELEGKRGGNWDSSDLARAHGCGAFFCVGDLALNKDRDYVRVRVVGVDENSQYVLEFLEGSLAGKRGGKWTDDSLVSIQ